ncbi:hypothetical protein HK096_011056, partial [Nowakowskiella sp. JEL0078]
MESLYPPFRFGTVEDDLYRGAYPKPRNHRFLTRLHLQTILSLTPDPPIPSLQAFCSRENISLLHIRVDKAKESVPLSFQRMAQILQILIDTTCQPLYLHCLDGVIVTGVAIMCLRKLQAWNIPAAMTEYMRFVREGVLGSEETEFVEKFQADIEIPVKIPKWLWGGVASFKKHPSLKIKFRSASTTSSGTNSSAQTPVSGEMPEIGKPSALKNLSKNIFVGSPLAAPANGSTTIYDESSGGRRRATTVEMFVHTGNGMKEWRDSSTIIETSGIDALNSNIVSNNSESTNTIDPKNTTNSSRSNVEDDEDDEE